jgi:hypothetical protein
MHAMAYISLSLSLFAYVVMRIRHSLHLIDNPTMPVVGAVETVGDDRARNRFRGRAGLPANRG